jgi:large subunit ribosomal protein L35
VEEVLSMPKMKSHSSSKKRFKITGTGKVKRNKAYKTHILTKKSTKRKRNLRKATTASSANEAIIKNMIPYK